MRGSRSGYWHTEGSRIVSDRQQTVRISGLNWSGFETPAAIAGGLRFQDYHAILKMVASTGYNTLRIPISNQMVEQPTVPSNIAFENEQGRINTDLEGLDSMQILDRIVAAAGGQGLKVILDDHRSEAGSSAEESGLWYTEQYPEQAWIGDWVTLAHHYRGNPTVIGFDLRNEPHSTTTSGACWSCGGERDWHLAAARAGDAILEENPNLLIFVEGVDRFEDTTDFWGGDLAGVRKAPIRLTVPGRLVYSVHFYGPNESSQPWFSAATTPGSLVAHWRRNWAYLSESGVAPVWIGEFGAPNDVNSLSSMAPGSEGQWFQTLMEYLVEHKEVGWTYWSLNGEDRYALLDGEYGAVPASPEKQALLARIQMPKPLVTEPLRGTSVLAHASLPKGLARFHFRLPTRPARKEAGPEMVVVYDEPHGDEPRGDEPGGRGASGGDRRSVPALPVTTRAEAPVSARTRTSGVSEMDARAHPRVKTPTAAEPVPDAMAEQIRRQTESALDHLTPDAK